MTNFPTRITSKDFPATLYRNSIGVDQWIDEMINRSARYSTANYPPYNIISVDKNNYLLEIACAGFTDKDITISVDNGVLTIVGNQEQETEETVEKNFLHRGISKRKWEQSFTLADYVEVKSATLSNGMLTIEVERILPEALKPRQIPITIK